MLSALREQVITGRIAGNPRMNVVSQNGLDRNAVVSPLPLHTT